MHPKVWHKGLVIREVYRRSLAGNFRENKTLLLWEPYY